MACRCNAKTASNTMKIISLYSLSLLQLVLCQSPLFIQEYNCTTDGIPAVVIVAGQGPGLPSVEFFLPMFNNCSTAGSRKPAQFAAGIFFSLSYLCALNTKQALFIRTTSYQDPQALWSSPILLTRMALLAVTRLGSSGDSSCLSSSNVWPSCNGA